MDSTHEYNLRQLKEQMDLHETTLQQIQATAQQNIAQMADLKRQLDLIAQHEGIDLSKPASETMAPVIADNLGPVPEGAHDAPQQSPQAGQAGSRGATEPPQPGPLGSTSRLDNEPPVVTREEVEARKPDSDARIAQQIVDEHHQAEQEADKDKDKAADKQAAAAKKDDAEKVAEAKDSGKSPQQHQEQDKPAGRTTPAPGHRGSRA